MRAELAHALLSAVEGHADCLRVGIVLALGGTDARGASLSGKRDASADTLARGSILEKDTISCPAKNRSHRSNVVQSVKVKGSSVRLTLFSPAGATERTAATMLHGRRKRLNGVGGRLTSHLRPPPNSWAPELSSLQLRIAARCSAREF